MRGSWMLSIVVGFSVLAGCAGSNDGSTTDAKQTQEPTTSSYSLTVSPAVIAVSSYESQTGTYLAKTVNVHVKFDGDGVLIGYPPGVPQPSWLTITPGIVQTPSKEINVPVKISPPANGKGRYEATIRFVTGDVNGENIVVRDLPVSLDIAPFPTVYSGSIAFAGSSTDVAPPVAQKVQLDFGAATGVIWSAQVESLNHTLGQLFELTTNAANAEVQIAPNQVPQIGQYQAQIVINLQIDGSVAKRTIPVTYTVAAGEPVIQFVAPPIGYVAEPGNLIIRGFGFDPQTIQDVRVDGKSVASFNVVNSTEIRCQYPALALSGQYTVEISTAGKTYQAPTGLLIKPRPVSTAFDTVLLSPVVHVVFDSVNDALLVSTDAILYRLKLGATNWAVDTSRAIGIGRFDLSPDSQRIVTMSGGVIELLDAVTLVDVESVNLGAMSLTAGRVLHVLNNGNVLIAASYTNATGARYFEFNLVNKTLYDTLRPVSHPLTRITNDREKILIVPNTIEASTDFGGYFDAATNEFVIKNQSIGYGANRVAFSGNGRRLLLGPLLTSNLPEGVYDENLSFVGALTGTTPPYNYSFEMSPDGTFGYKVDAGDAKIYKFDLTAVPPYPSLGVMSFTTPFSHYAAGPITLVTPDGRMMILAGGQGNSNTREKRLVIVPLGQ